MHEAPQVAPNLPRLSAHALLRRLREGFGDTSLIRAAELGAPPPITRQHEGWFGRGVHPPANALWLYLRAAPSPRGAWAEVVFAGALRDELCLHRSQPLVGWSDGRVRGGLSDAENPFGQHFPEPSESTYRRRVDAIAHSYGFRVASLDYLRGFQRAPMIVVETTDRKAFARDAAQIVARLDPYASGAVTFEAFFLEARDADGSFLRVFNAHRGVVMGGQWAWDERYLPYAHG
jgi:hypothetical protein